MVEESKSGGQKKFTKKEKQEHFKEKKREAAAKRKEEAKNKQKENPNFGYSKKEKYDKPDRYEGFCDLSDGDLRTKDQMPLKFCLKFSFRFFF